MSSDGEFNVHIQWHRHVHQEWGKERLYFWRLSFAPVYDPARVVKALRVVLAEHRILSYALYELWGEADLLLRMWLPTTSTAADFSESLKAHLLPLQLNSEDEFQVRRHLRHWVWDDEPENSAPSAERLLQPLDDGTIQAANRDGLSDDELARYEADGLLKRTLHAHGVKFAMLVTDSARAVPISHRDAVQARLLELVGAETLKISERSLYEGSGFGNYLIMGRVDYPNYQEIQKLADMVNEVIAPGTYGARTHTMLASHHDFKLFQEQLPPSDVVATTVDEVEAYELLDSGEGGDLEVKASAFRDVDHALGLRQDAPSTESETVLRLLRGVVAMLNTDGGTVMVGAYERDRLPLTGDESWSHFPQLTKYVIFGVEYDVDGDNLDKYERRIREKLNTGIEPPPLLWVTPVWNEVLGKTILKLAVGRPDRDWYFLKRGQQRDFVVRLGNQSKVLTGREMIDWQRDRPRG